MKAGPGSPSGQVLRTAPAVVLLVPAAVGIIVDRYGELPLRMWCLMAVVAIFASLAVRCVSAGVLPGSSRGLGNDGQLFAGKLVCVGGHWIRSATRFGAGVILAVFSLAGAWHHWHYSTLRHDDVAHRCSVAGEPVPVWLRGRALEAVTRVKNLTAGAPGYAAEDSRFCLGVTALRRADGWCAASGTVWVYVNGTAPFMLPGDQVTVCGHMARYRSPLNPGERDYSALHRAQGERVFVISPVSSCVQVKLTSPVTCRWWLPRIRCRATRILQRSLSPDLAALAAALLLGNREELPEPMQDAFLRTGTGHLLAISGLHVGILAAPWLFAARANLIPFRASLCTLIVVIGLYAGLTGMRAPVVRAGVLIQTVCLAWITRRRISLGNSLAVAGLVVLALNPTELFRTGTQLSFLAVATLGRCAAQRQVIRPEDPLDRLMWRSRPWWRRSGRYLIARWTHMFRTSLAVWLVTAPLVVDNFHIVSPLTVPLNWVLCPFLVLGLQFGFVLLLWGEALPSLAQGPAYVCETNLRIMAAIVRRVDEVPGAHFWLPGPGALAVTSCYVLIALGWILARRSRRRWLCYGLACGCLVAGWSHKAWLRHERRDDLRCTFLSVGHGTCVVLQLPGGKVWIYDAGRRGSIRGGVDCVARYLWSQGIGRLDAVVISHADVDHYNLVPGLVDRFSIGQVYLGPHDLRLSHPSEAWLASQLKRRGIRLQHLLAGRHWRLGKGASVTVLHPPRSHLSARERSTSDNAQSVVLSVQYRETTLLLTGDLEREGIDQLVSREPRSVLVAMAPHHGSVLSQPERLLAWCRPKWWVVSGARAAVNDIWRPPSARSRFLHTAIDGAVQVDVGPDGTRVRTFRASVSRTGQ